MNKMEFKTKKGDFAVFDFDNTLIFNDIAEAVLAYLCRNLLLRNKNLLGRPMADGKKYHRAVFLRYYQLLGKGKILQAYSLCNAAIAGFSVSEIKGLVRNTLKFEGSKIGSAKLYGLKIAKGIKLRRESINLLKSIKKRGLPIWVITASPELLVKAMLEIYKIPANLIGVKNRITNGVVSDSFRPPLSILGGKVACIKKYIHPAKHPIIGVGDSLNDVPMLNYSRYKVVVNRGGKLGDIARKKNWFIIARYQR